MNIKFGDLVIAQEKSKIKAGEGKKEGTYKFFTSSNTQTKYVDFFQYDKPALIFGTGGVPSVHYCDERFSVSTDCIVFYSKSNDYTLKSLYLFFESHMKVLEEGFHGAGLQHISRKYILNIQIPNITIDKQLKINDIGDKLNKIIDLKKQQLDSYNELVKSRFIEMFGDPVNNPYEWQQVALGKRCEIITGNTPSRAEPENYGSYIEWIKSDNINTPFTYLTEAQEYLSKTGFLKCRFVNAGNLLMTCIAGSISCIGNVAVTDRRVAFNQQINAIVPNGDEVLYIYWLMQMIKPSIQSNINMALKGILSKRQLSEMMFPFPPTELQKQFAAFVKHINKSKFENFDIIDLICSYYFYYHFYFQIIKSGIIC